MPKVSKIVCVKAHKINAIKTLREMDNLRCGRIELIDAKNIVEAVLNHVRVDIEKTCDLGHAHVESMYSGHYGNSIITTLDDAWD